MFWKTEKTAVITTNELEAEIAENRSPLIIDVRSKKDFRIAHLPSAINIPLENLEEREHELDETKSTVFY